MKKIDVNVNNSYSIFIENDSIDHLGEYISKFYKHGNIYIITDERVGNLYIERAKSSLQGYNVFSCTIEGYERAKCIDVYMELIHELINKGIRRNHLLVALGGGVIGDLTGFIAGTLYRGIDYIQVPTSLLAQTDSSIGGKTGIDIAEGKNLIGVFKQPRMVVIDPTTLKTLPKKEYANGLSEMIKHGLIGDKKIVKRLALSVNVDEDLLHDSIMVKKRFVEADVFDTGERMFLNFGHTFGHAIEKEYNYSKYSHGEAVAIGMLMAIKTGEKLGVTQGVYEDVEKILIKAGLPIITFPITSYIELIKNDKKNIAGVLNLILLEDIGKPIVYQVKENELDVLI